MIDAALGFALILFRNAGNRTLLGAGLALSLFGTLLNALFPLLTERLVTLATLPAVLAAGLQVYATGNCRDLVRDKLRQLPITWTTAVVPGWVLPVLGKFLLGYCIGRCRLLQDVPAHLPLFRRLLSWDPIVGVIGNAVWVILQITGGSALRAPRSVLEMLAQPVVHAGALGLAACHLAVLALLFQRPAWRSRLAVLAPVGRMALTNYLGQPLIYVCVFYGIGLGRLARSASRSAWHSAWWCSRPKSGSAAGGSRVSVSARWSGSGAR